MTLEDYDRTIAPHLHFIEAGASMAARHAQLLVSRPEWETRAEDELSRVRQVLTAALTTVIATQEVYQRKPVEN